MMTKTETEPRVGEGEAYQLRFVIPHAGHMITHHATYAEALRCYARIVEDAEPDDRSTSIWHGGECLVRSGMSALPSDAGPRITEWAGPDGRYPGDVASFCDACGLDLSQGIGAQVGYSTTEHGEVVCCRCGSGDGSALPSTR